MCKKKIQNYKYLKIKIFKNIFSSLRNGFFLSDNQILNIPTNFIEARNNLKRKNIEQVQTLREIVLISLFLACRYAISRKRNFVIDILFCAIQTRYDHDGGSASPIPDQREYR